jgi:hypothetical protein
MTARAATSAAKESTWAVAQVTADHTKRLAQMTCRRLTRSAT